MQNLFCVHAWIQSWWQNAHAVGTTKANAIHQWQSPGWPYREPYQPEWEEQEHALVPYWIMCEKDDPVEEEQPHAHLRRFQTEDENNEQLFAYTRELDDWNCWWSSIFSDRLAPARNKPLISKVNTDQQLSGNR